MSIEFEENLQQQARRERINIHFEAYTAGCVWVTTKILTKIKCNECKNDLPSVDSTHEFIKQNTKKYTLPNMLLFQILAI